MGQCSVCYLRVDFVEREHRMGKFTCLGSNDMSYKYLESPNESGGWGS